MKKIMYISLAVIIVIFASGFINISVSHSGFCRVFPYKTLKLIRSNDGRYRIDLINNKKGIVESTQDIIFDRGENAELIFSEHISHNNKIEKNSPILTIRSVLMNSRLLELEEKLYQNNALIKLQSSGDKLEVLKKLKSQLAFSNKKAEKFSKILQRQKTLFTKKLIAEEEYETALSDKELAELEIEIAERNILVAQSGKKNDEIKYFQSISKSLEKEILDLKNIMQKYTISSPVDGVVLAFNKGDTLLTINDYSQLIFFMENNNHNNLGLQNKFANIEFADTSIQIKVVNSITLEPGKSRSKALSLAAYKNVNNLIPLQNIYKYHINERDKYILSYIGEILTRSL